MEEESMITNKWLPEQLISISNLCQISQILIDMEREDLLPTALELLFELAQQITDENCIKV